MSIAELARGAAVIESFAASVREKGGQGVVQIEAAQMLALCDVVVGLRTENQTLDKSLKALEKTNQEIKRANNTVMQKFHGREEWDNEVKGNIAELQILSAPKKEVEFLQDQVNKLEKNFLKQMPEVEARMSTVMETFEQSNERRKTQTGQVDDKVSLLQIQVADMAKRLREEKHRVENSANHAVSATGDIKKLQTHLSELEETLKADFKKVAKVVKALQEEVKNRPAGGGGGGAAAGTGGGGAGSAEAAVDGATGLQLKMRVERLEERENDVHANFERQSKRIRKLEENDSVALISALSKKCGEMNVRHENFEQHMADQLFNLRSREVSHVVTAFKQKWTRFKAENDSLLLKESVAVWIEYRDQRNDARRSLQKVEQLFVNRHAGGRFRTWWYAAQKDLHRKEFEHLNDYTTSMQAQLTTATSTMSKRDKSTSEHFREISARVNQAEKKLDSIQQKKADMTVVRDLVGTLEARFAQDYDFDGVRTSIAQVWEFIKPLEANKAEAAIVATHAHKLNELAYELRQGFQKHDEHLQLKATIVDMSRKADAMRVDEVMKILASQMDRLTAVTTQDFEQLRHSVQRFLELSPDLRKAALSNGLMPREECMACSMLNKTPRSARNAIQDKSIPVQTIQGTNNVLYRLSPVAGKNYTEQAEKIISEKLKFPTRLKQSVSMAREQSMDTPLRSLMNKGANWLAGAAETSQAHGGARGSTARVSAGSVATSQGAGDDGGNRFSLRAFFPSAGGAPAPQHNQSTSDASTVSKGSSPGRAASASPMPPAGMDSPDSRSPSPVARRLSASPDGASDATPLDASPRRASPSPVGNYDDGEAEEDPLSPGMNANGDGYAGMQDYEDGGSFMSSNQSDYDD